MITERPYGSRRVEGKRDTGLLLTMRRLFISLGMALVLLAPLTARAASPSPSPSPSSVPAAQPGQVLINEIMANPVGTDTGTEWVELSNLADVSLPIGGMTVVRASGSTLLTVPAGTTIEAHGYKRFMASGSIVNGGDTLLLKLGTLVYDQATYDAAGVEGQSWNRISLTEGTWSDTPTPDAANAVQTVAEEEPVSAVSSSTSTTASSSKKAANTKKVSASKLPKSGPGTVAYLIPLLGWALWRYGRERFLHGNQR
jgi:hypothetical protein